MTTTSETVKHYKHASISAITIENFKAIKKPIRIELKPITLLFGPNSAGKSTIIQAFHYAHEIFEYENVNPYKTHLGGQTMDLGGFDSLVFGHDKSLPIKLGFELDVTDVYLPEYYDDNAEFLGIGWIENSDSAFLREVPRRVKKVSIEITISWNEKYNKPFVSKYFVSMNGESLLTIDTEIFSEEMKKLMIEKGIVSDLSSLSPNPDSDDLFLKINPFNPVFFNGSGSKIKAEKARKLFYKYSSKEFKLKRDGEDDYDKGDYLRFIEQFARTNIIGFRIGLSLNKKSKSALPSWDLPLYVNPDFKNEENASEYYSNFRYMLSALAVGPGKIVRDFLREFYYLGPLRKIPPRNYVPERFQDSHDLSRWANGLAAYDILFSGEDKLIEQVNDWLIREDRLATGYAIKIKKYRELENSDLFMRAVRQNCISKNEIDHLLALPVMRRLLFHEVKENFDLMPQDIGVGISQILPIVVAAISNIRGLVSIEQPELHIHPAMQVALGDLFIAQTSEKPDLTFVLETHSEHLLLRLLRRIRETTEGVVQEDKKLVPDKLSIYFIEPGEKGISCTPIRVDEEGDFIDRWPQGFFDERAGELFG